MNEEANNPSIDPELEARVVALVLGEASDFERDDLNRLIQERPELAAFREEIERVHGLLRDVGAGESVAEDDDWKLPAEKRNAVLAGISPEAKEHPEIRLAIKSADQGRSEQMRFLGNIAKIAAVLLVAGFFGSLGISSWLAANARMQRVSRIIRSPFAASESMTGEASAPGARILMSDGAVVTVDEEYVQEAEATISAEPDHNESLRSSLSAIRESLRADANLPSPYYLMDDVQYAPVRPRLNVPQEETASGEAGAAEMQTRAPPIGVNGPGPGLLRPPADDLALIPRSVESSGADASEDALARRDSSSFYAELREGESDSGGEGQGDRRAASEKPGRSPEFAMPAVGAEESGRNADLSINGFANPTGRIAYGAAVNGAAVNSDAGATDAKPSAAAASQGFRGGTNLRHSIEAPPADSPADGKERDFEGAPRDREWRNRQAQAGERLHVDGSAAAATPGNSWSTRLSPGELSKTAPRKPMVAGSGGRKREVDKDSNQELFDAGIVDVPTPDMFTLDGRRSGSRSSRMEDANDDGVVDENDAQSMFGSTNRPMAMGEDLKKKGIAKSLKEEFSKDRLAMPSDKGIALGDDQMLYEKSESNGRQIPVPMTGTAIGVPRSALQVGKANQDQQWGYDGQPKTPQEGPAALKKRPDYAVPDDYREGVETYDQRFESGQRGKQGELLQQRDQLAANEPSRGYWYVPLTSNKRTSEFAESAGDRIVRDSVAGRHFIDKTKKAAAPAGLNEKTAAEEAYSTFSLHVSDVSFKLARAALASGTWPEAAKIRIEEFVNAFDYGDPMPSQSEKVTCRVEQAVHPFLQQRNLLRVSMRTAAAGRWSNTPLRLTFLLDNSGSMERIDRQQTVRRAFALLAGQLKPIDQVTLISFARQPRLLADKVGGAQSSQLVELIENLPSEGGTNIEAALQLAFEKAREQQLDSAQNRIILLTDGAVNLGDANPESLSRMITTMRGAGIAFDAAGISAEGLNDEILEALTRKGDGRYYLLDSIEAADDGFARQIAGALRPSAGNVKVQVEFNPKRVGRYKLLGFEKHRLKQEDFRNDKVDAAEMAAAEAGVAVYQFEAKPDGEGDVGSVSVRFRDLSTQQMIENCWPIPYQADAPRLDHAAPSLRIATSAALLAAKLRGEALGETVDFKTLSKLIAGLPDQDRNANRVGQLQQMIEQARQVSGK